MEMNERDFAAIDRALGQRLENGKITETCPRCGKKLIYIQTGSADEVTCQAPKCISEVFRGI